MINKKDLYSYGAIFLISVIIASQHDTIGGWIVYGGSVFIMASLFYWASKPEKNTVHEVV